MSGNHHSVRPVRLLIVDDKPEMRQIFASLLSFEDDLEIIGTAADGQQAIEQTLKLQPQVILMDIEMPVMDGLAATHQIKKLHPTIQIIVMSSEVRFKTRAMEAGAANFLVKPFEAEEAASAIRLAVAPVQPGL